MEGFLTREDMLDEVVAWLEIAERQPNEFTASDIADRTGRHPNTERNRLERMVIEGKLVRRKSGRSVFYSIADDTEAAAETRT
jgi:DNA-binding transcriptional regulator PaaX